MPGTVKRYILIRKLENIKQYFAFQNFIHTTSILDIQLQISTQNTWTLTKHSGHPCWVKSGLLWSWRGMHNAISEFIFGEEDCQHLNGIFAHIFGRCWQTQEVYPIVHLQTRNGWVRLTGYHMDKIILLSAISYRKLFYLYNFLKTTDVRENICNKTSKN